MKQDQEIRQSIRRGLKKLGVDAVRNALPSFEDFGLNSFCGCFIGRAFGWEGKALDFNEAYLNHEAFLFHKMAAERIIIDRDLITISHAHLHSDMRLKEEVMIFLAENGEAIEPNPRDNKNVCLNST